MRGEPVRRLPSSRQGTRAQLVGESRYVDAPETGNCRDARALGSTGGSDSEPSEPARTARHRRNHHRRGHRGRVGRHGSRCADEHRSRRERQGGQARLHLLRDRLRRFDVQERGQGVQGAHRPRRTPRAASTAARSRSRYIDDQSSGANLTAAQDLVQNRKVFAVVNNSSFAFLAYRYLLGAGVPMVGGGYDGTYYGQKGNETMLSALGNAAPFNGLGVRQHHQGHEAARRQEGRRDRLRRLAVVDRLGPDHPAIRRAGAGAQAGLHQHLGRLRQHRRRAHRPRHQELGRRRGRTSRWWRRPTSPSSRGSSRTA